MQKDIKCIVCDEVIGTIEKVSITDSDVVLYQSMVTCSNGHSHQVALEEHQEIVQN